MTRARHSLARSGRPAGRPLSPPSLSAPCGPWSSSQCRPPNLHGSFSICGERASRTADGFPTWGLAPPQHLRRLPTGRTHSSGPSMRRTIPVKGQVHRTPGASPSSPTRSDLTGIGRGFARPWAHTNETTPVSSEPDD